eukprot:GFUD01022083.1.p1 GENE.GFUD01022083.1~~GFUD01022083.1.p1  ORF type:complete len:792 (+),score=254.36 GFUD01022083.1:41-2416(+)
MKKSREKVAPDLSSLLVFGYACKLFRDDGKALSLEKGDHLIPWMGDSSMKIDRYDGRGHLYNLSQYESKAGTTEKLGDLEKHEEELCDEERWRSLHRDDSEDIIKEEEEQKRAKSFAQFQFNYDDPKTEPIGAAFGPENTTNPEDYDESEPYEPSSELDLPCDIIPPQTIKLFSVIEKTAILIAGQGPQMEILLKAKQSGNPVFEFLSMDHTLYKFYKHLVMLVKTRQYKKKDPPPPPGVSLVPQYSDSAPIAPNLAPKVVSIPYKRSEDCSYSQLITNLQKYAPTPEPPPPPTITPPPLEKTSTPPPPPPTASLLSGPIVIPPTDLQTIIDKMASYVARNGRSFEEVVRTKDENRFRFLSPDDKHHNYYLHKLAIYTTGNYDPSVASEPLTFKLKKPDSGKESSLGPSNAISGLDYGSDSEDNQEDKKEKDSGLAKKSDDKTSDDKKSGFPSLVGFLPPAIAAQPKLYQDEEEDKEKKKREEKAKKRQEETNKLRDKLAAKAREKMVLAAKEKALQLERKRKAAHFLAQLAEKKTSVSSVTAVDTPAESSAEEGELVCGGPADNHQEQMTAEDADQLAARLATDTVTAVSIWPPPTPPKLVIPKLSGQTESPVELSSDSEEERRRRKKRRRSRSRSRTRDRKHERSRHKIKRSRSKHKKYKKHKSERRRHNSDSDKDLKPQKRRNRSLSSDRGNREKRPRKHISGESDSDQRQSKSSSRTKDPTCERVGTKENTPDTLGIKDCGSREGTPEISVIKERHNPIIEGIVQPKVNKMTEDLRAKVRAMLETKK